jgi:outer membrane protein OmpA-like peptidoglycan-associated protein
LYYFDLYKEALPIHTTFLKGTIVDADASTPVAANVQLIDLETGNVIAESNADPIDGSYLVSIPNGKDYALNVSSKGYLFYSENFTLKNHPTEKPFLINVGLKPISVGGTVVLKNIFFESESYVLKDESKVELNKLIYLLTQNPSLKIQISGHTDNVGSEEFNKALSVKRASAVANYLVSKGISSERLQGTRARQQRRDRQVLQHEVQCDLSHVFQDRREGRGQGSALPIPHQPGNRRLLRRRNRLELHQVPRWSRQPGGGALRLGNSAGCGESGQ